jgi:hypothetical protein
MSDSGGSNALTWSASGVQYLLIGIGTNKHSCLFLYIYIFKSKSVWDPGSCQVDEGTFQLVGRLSAFAAREKQLAGL